MICCTCKEEKNESDFFLRKKGSNERAAQCKLCNKIAAKASRDKKMNQFKELKKGLACLVCGESNECCVSFHHKDPNEKLFAISAAYKTRTIEEIKEEIAKCIPLCENCHAKYHNGLNKELVESYYA